MSGEVSKGKLEEELFGLTSQSSHIVPRESKVWRTVSRGGLSRGLLDIIWRMVSRWSLRREGSFADTPLDEVSTSSDAWASFGVDS